MGTNSGIYKLLLVLHLLAVVVGIGTVFLNGLYAAQAKRRGGVAGQAVSEANYDVSSVAEKFIYAIPVFGILLVLLSDDQIEFTELWIWLSTLLYVAALGVSHAVLIPSHRRMNQLAPTITGTGPELAEAEALEKKMGAAGALLNVIVVVIIALMVWKP
jgi:hypothetical protein